MKKREANFTTYFRHWLKSNPMVSAAFELKQTTIDSIPFDSVREHQADSLEAVCSDVGFSFKLPDDSMGYKPFDLIYFRNEEGYVVIRYPKEFHIISIETWLIEKAHSKRKSLTCDRAREISIKSVKM